MTSYVKLLLGLLLISGVNCKFVKFCYFATWGVFWLDKDVQMNVEDINPYMCTHLVWGYATVDEYKAKIVPRNELIDESTTDYKGRMEQFTDLKEQNPKLKTILGILGSEQLAAISEVAISRNTFSRNVFKYIVDHKFDGLEICWENPPPSKEKKTAKRFVALLESLRKVFNDGKSNLIITTGMVPNSETYEDVETIHSLVDYLLLRTYDYYSHGSTVVGFGSPLHSPEGSDYKNSVSWTVNHYIKSYNVSPSKIVVGISLAFTRFVLADKTKNVPGSPTKIETREGNLYGGKNFLGYPEVCQMIREQGAKTHWDKTYHAQYLVSGDNFVSYETDRSIDGKIKWLSSKKVAGVSVWSLGLDDHNGKFCDEGYHPLFNAINAAMMKYDAASSSGGDTTAKHATLTFMSLCFLLSFIRM